MPSSLRFSVSASAIQSTPIYHPNTYSPPLKKQKMSLTQTYYLAHKARGKLSKEAARADHNLRRLVGHANLLDGLMLDLADAERDQESWFNQSVRGAVNAAEEPRHVQWADTIPEEAVEDDEEEEWGLNSDTDSDSDEEDVDPAPRVPRRRPSPPTPTVTPTVTTTEVDEEDMEDDEDYEDALVLTRTASHPPDLLHESDSDSEDDPMPASPPQPDMPLDAFSEKQRQAIATTSFYQSIPDSSDREVASLPPSEQASFFDEGFYLPQRQPHTAILAGY